MTRRIVTCDQVTELLDEAWRSPDAVAALCRAVGDGVTARRLAEADHVPIDDRRWLLVHLLARGRRPSLRALVGWACGCASDVVHFIADESAEGAARYAIEAALRWSQGESVPLEVLQEAHATVVDSDLEFGAPEWRAERAVEWLLYATSNAQAGRSARVAAAVHHAARYTAECAPNAWAQDHLLELAAILDAGP
jgi:hypothetical protein